MASSNTEATQYTSSTPSTEAKYINFPSLHLTRNMRMAMPFAAGIPDRDTLTKSLQVGIASVWWEGNPCNMHFLDLGKTVKKAIADRGMIGWQYNTIGVSDGITMGTEGMR
ncbi:hypothetical protein MPDQ_003051 [Monascus purpureus]|uniref:Dihydroxy-acid/6-phosphogluconate dehydratase N-terminal domain-containing protein n=1 Tax=Monascus purpureus TaxID=5098 RepID=A0A507R3H6_MONPU|nr:hypothetical protein MPDQ_003051 [Monascus purpureus]BDD59379.1 hypothetical protein MAP00_004588 [Monascus purpureus]